MSTADHPQTNGQAERLNCVLEDILGSFCADKPKRWSSMLPGVEFALNNSVYASTGTPPFDGKGLTHRHVLLELPRKFSVLNEEEIASWLDDVSPVTG